MRCCGAAQHIIYNNHNHGIAGRTAAAGHEDALLPGSSQDSDGPHPRTPAILDHFLVTVEKRGIEENCLGWAYAKRLRWITRTTCHRSAMFGR